MQSKASAAGKGVYVASGYGLKIYVERGHLVVHDGIGRDRRSERFARATSELKRLMVIGHTGFVTLEALRWLQDVGAAFIQVDADGQIVTLSAAQPADLAILRRSQALALTNGMGLEISRRILADKVAGQLGLLDELPADAKARYVIARALDDIAKATDFDPLLAAEAAAAGAYWNSWAAVPVSFSRSDAKHVPEHWLSFGKRQSPLTRSPRLAVNPANGVLNYLYAMLEAETSLACHAVGLDPGVGLFHVDRNARASLALDVMEACRPVVDAYVLALLTGRILRASGFVETRRGSCRLHPAMTRELARTATTWQKHVAPVSEYVAQAIADGSVRPAKPPTPLTRSTKVESWDGRRWPDPVHRSTCNESRWSVGIPS